MLVRGTGTVSIIVSKGSFPSFSPFPETSAFVYYLIQHNTEEPRGFSFNVSPTTESKWQNSLLRNNLKPQIWQCPELRALPECENISDETQKYKVVCTDPRRYAC